MKNKQEETNKWQPPLKQIIFQFFSFDVNKQLNVPTVFLSKLAEKSSQALHSSLLHKTSTLISIKDDWLLLN